MDISISHRTAHAVSGAVVRLTLTVIFLGMASRVAPASVSFIGTNIGGGGNGIAVADVNGDGKLDIIEANGGVTVFLGNGDGTFQAARQFAAGQSASSVVVADFNGDGKLDIAVSDGTTYSVYILLGKGDGTFQPARQFLTGTGVNPVQLWLPISTATANLISLSETRVALLAAAATRSPSCWAMATAHSSRR
jgi:hypothetical protein